MSPPHDHFEREYQDKGYKLIAGVDEVGVGCLAGPVIAAAVILKKPIEGVDDSKKLSPKKREQLDFEIRKNAIAISIGFSDVEEIDRLNIFVASRLAMERAVLQLTPKPDFLLVDGRQKLSLPHLSIVRGDQISVSISAASIIAKVYRDRLMTELDEKFPGFHFAKHKGYGSLLHRKALQEKGETPIHRKSFSWKPV